MNNPNLNKYNKKLKSVQKGYDDNYCLPNVDYSQIKDKRTKYWKKQKKKYGFADTETWSLDYTASIWLYMHIKMMLDIGGQTVNYEWDWWTDEFREELKAEGVDVSKCKNDKDVFEYICKLIEKSDAYEVDGNEDKAIPLRQKAFKIFAVMMPRAWW